MIDALARIVPLQATPVALHTVIELGGDPDPHIARSVWRYVAAWTWRHALEHGSSPAWFDRVLDVADDSPHREDALATLVASPKHVATGWIMNALRAVPDERAALHRLARRGGARSQIAEHVVEGGRDARTYYDEAVALLADEISGARGLWSVTLEVAEAVVARMAAQFLGEFDRRPAWSGTAGVVLASEASPLLDGDHDATTDGLVVGEVLQRSAKARRRDRRDAHSRPWQQARGHERRSRGRDLGCHDADARARGGGRERPR